MMLIYYYSAELGLSLLLCLRCLVLYSCCLVRSLAELIADRDLYESPISCKENEERYIVTDSWNDSNGEVHTTTREMIY